MHNKQLIKYKICHNNYRKFFETIYFKWNVYGEYVTCKETSYKFKNTYKYLYVLFDYSLSGSHNIEQLKLLYAWKYDLMHN